MNKDRRYYTHRLGCSQWASGMAHEHILLNLGAHYCFPRECWSDLCVRVSELLTGQQPLFTPSSEIEQEARYLVRRIQSSRRQGTEAVDVDLIDDH